MLIVIILLIAVIAFISFFRYRERGQHIIQRLSIPELSPDELDSLSDLSFFFPADENPSLTTDLYTTIFEEDQLMHYLIVPHDFDVSEAVCYAVDTYGQLLSRHVISFDGSNEYRLGLRTIILTYTELPVLAINISPDSPSMEQLDASDKTVECLADIIYTSAPKAAKEYNPLYDNRRRRETGGSATITGRGNVSWDHSPKKSYSITFRESTYIPGLGRNRNWNLISNSQDKSLLNNEVFYRMSTITGIEYEPSYIQVTLYINGRYHGVYMITSKISVDPDRIPLGKGDFLMNFGDPDTSHAIYYDTKLWLDNESTKKPYANIKWPKTYSSSEEAEQTRIIQRCISAVEDPSNTHYTEYLDLDSMVRYYWIQEISMNYDADYRSAYAYYRKSADKIFMGPVWDLDLALGWNADKFYSDYTSPQGWKVRMMSTYACLFEHEDFAQAVSDAYWNGGIREAMYDALDRYKLRGREMAVDGQLNYRRWRTDWPALSLYVSNNYNEECSSRIAFFSERVKWIDEQMKLSLDSSSSDYYPEPLINN